MSNLALKLEFLRARDARQQKLDSYVAHSALENMTSIFFISSNIPGNDKYRTGICHLLCNAIDSLKKGINLKILSTHRDILGPFYIAISPLSPIDAKMAAMALENQHASNRLLDIDVYSLDGSQVDRAKLGFAPRRCLLCDEPANECILLKRHSIKELLNYVDGLLQPLISLPCTIIPEQLATNLVFGTMCELNLTPKPGLVDRSNNGSHADLSYAKMLNSIKLLPIFFNEILNCHRQQRLMQNFVQIGVAAENRMLQRIGTNTHKGFIFLSGILLMAVCQSNNQIENLRLTIASIAKDFFNNFSVSNSYNNTVIRNYYKLGGIRLEIEEGLPAIFEYGWPKYREAIKADWKPLHADFYLMAILMQYLEDTTAVRRCGLDGLARLRRDGRNLQLLLEKGQDPEQMLSALNQEYCKLGLTMGGVADCMALTFALQKTIS